MFKCAIPAFAALSLAATGAQAKELQPVSVTVPYADLDLSTGAGASTLQNRIETALKSVCDRPSSRDIKAVSAWQKCRADARQGAVAQIDEARLPIQVAAR